MIREREWTSSSSSLRQEHYVPAIPTSVMGQEPSSCIHPTTTVLALQYQTKANGGKTKNKLLLQSTKYGHHQTLTGHHNGLLSTLACCCGCPRKNQEKKKIKKEGELFM